MTAASLNIYALAHFAYAAAVGGGYSADIGAAEQTKWDLASGGSCIIQTYVKARSNRAGLVELGAGRAARQ